MLNFDTLLHAELEKIPESRKGDNRYRAVVDLLLKGYSPMEIVERLKLDWKMSERIVRRFEEKERKHSHTFRNIRELGIEAKKAIETAATAGRIISYENFIIDELNVLRESLSPTVEMSKGLEIPDGDVKFQALLKINGLEDNRPDQKRQDLIQTYVRKERIVYRYDESKKEKRRPMSVKFRKAQERLSAREKGEEEMGGKIGKSAMEFEDASILKTHFKG